MFKGDIYLTMYIVIGVVAGIAFSKADTAHGGVVPLVIALGVYFVAFMLVSRARPLIKILVLAVLIGASIWLYFFLFANSPAALRPVL